MSGHGVGPVRHELGIDKALKDLRDEHSLCRSTVGAYIDPAIAEPNVGGAISVRGFFIAKGAVGIGEHFPTAHDQVELVEREMLRVLDEQVDHVQQLAAASRVCECPSQRMQLGHTHEAVMSSGRNSWRSKHEAPKSQVHRCFIGRPPCASSAPTGDACMTIGCVGGSAVGFGHKLGQAGLNTATLAIERSEQRPQIEFGHYDHIEHMYDHTTGV